MSFLSYALGAIILVLVLLRQVRVRPVPRVYQPRLPVVLGVIGLFEMFGYAGDHHVSAERVGMGHRHVGHRRVGFRRAARPHHAGLGEPAAGCVRQGTALTMGLWLVSLLIHFAGDYGGDHAGAAGLAGASFLLYLGVTLSVQYYVVYRRRCLCGSSSGPTPVGRCSSTSRRTPGSSSPPSDKAVRAVRAARADRPVWGLGPGPGTRRPQRHRRRGRRRRRARAARTPRAGLIVPTLGGRDRAPQLQPAALRRPTRVHRAVPGPPRGVGGLPRGRDLRAGRGPGRPAPLGGGTSPGRTGWPAPGPGALRRHLRQHAAAHRPRRRRPCVARTGMTPVVDADLREVFLGEWEGGLLRQKAMDHDPVFQRVMTEQRWDIIPGAESRHVFGGRLRRPSSASRPPTRPGGSSSSATAPPSARSWPRRRTPRRSPSWARTTHPSPRSW